ncbi:putative leucine rich repeat protein, partial [Candidatus Magnetomorum sp. HK-1]
MEKIVSIKSNKYLKFILIFFLGLLCIFEKNSYSKPFSVEQTYPQRDILTHIYDLTGGGNWKNYKNWLDDSQSECSWFGVTCDETKNVIMLRLGDNNLSGQIPNEILKLKNLKELDLGGNQQISGTLSDFIVPASEKLLKLERLFLCCMNLSGSIPPEIGNFNKLNTLHLQANKLSGQIPNELLELNNLKELDLGGNKQMLGTLSDFIVPASNRKKFNQIFFDQQKLN